MVELERLVFVWVVGLCAGVGKYKSNPPLGLPTAGLDLSGEASRVGLAGDTAGMLDP